MSTNLPINQLTQKKLTLINQAIGQGMLLRFQYQPPEGHGGLRLAKPQRILLTDGKLWMLADQQVPSHNEGLQDFLISRLSVIRLFHGVTK